VPAIDMNVNNNNNNNNQDNVYGDVIMTQSHRESSTWNTR